MAISKDLVDVLCCPVTKERVRLANAEELQGLNAAIKAGTLTHMDGSKVEETLEEALITNDGARIYKIIEGIPIMLKDKAIPAGELSVSKS
jgi:uncharacterized protein YbaR (Trm112 family)